MERLIRNVTKKFVNLLPENQSFFTPDDLREYDIPEFLIQRIEVEIYRNLNESVVPPHSEWADMTADDVENAWEQFIDAIVAEVRMPASYATSVFETSVADVVEMILQPRTAIPSILFGPESELQKSDLHKMTRFITVNSHLANAILKYMDRRNKNKLHINTCKQIVERVDERLTQNFNSLNWAQHLQPLFLLAGPKVDSELFRIFFESRNMQRISQRFDQMDTALDKTRFIEVLSSPDLLDEEMYDVKKSSKLEAAAITSQYENHSKKIKSDLFSVLDKKSKSDPLSKKQDSNKIDEEKYLKLPKEEESNLEIESEEEAEDTLLASFQNRLRSSDDSDKKDAEDTSNRSVIDSYSDSSIEEEEQTEESDLDNEPPLHSRFFSAGDGDYGEISDQQEWPDQTERERTFSEQFTDEVDETDEADEIEDSYKYDEIEAKRTESVKSDISINPEKDDAEDKSISDVDVDNDEDEEEEDEIDAGFLFGEKTSVDEDDEEINDRPIWQAFLGDEENIQGDDIDDIEDPAYSGFAELEDEDVDDDPILPLLKEAEKKEKAEKLVNYLQKNEKQFVDSIFNGSYEDYENALLKINDFNNWKQAGIYIGKEIFAPNNIDIYEDEAVKFIDKLQSYFDEFKS